VDLSDADVSEATWGDDAVCPDGTLSGDHGGTCAGHLSPSDNNGDNNNNDNNNANNSENNANNSDPEDVKEDPDLEEDPDVAQDAQEDAPDQECEPNACGGCGPLRFPINEPCDPCLTGVGRCDGAGGSYCYRGGSDGQCGAQCEVNDDCDARQCINGRCSLLNLAWIEPGRFGMGSPEDEPGRYDDEIPHEVTITRPFFAMQREVEAGTWEVFFPGGFDDSCDQCAMGRVSWYSALIFANRLSLAVGLQPCYANERGEPFDNADLGPNTVTPAWPDGLDCLGWRLPTEAEWEYMARAGTVTPWSCGDDEACLPDVAWYEGHPGPQDNRANPTGQLQPNAWGLYDTHGNAWEWVWDGYDPELTMATDPIIGERPAGRVLRGGGFNDEPSALRVAFRNTALPVVFGPEIGVRLVRTIRPLD
jgi:hypothetical protein